MSISHLKSPRYGSSLADGKAHAVDHLRWTRRNFLASLGLLGAGSFLLGPSRVRAYANSPLLAQLKELNNNRILVLIQLSGGNDGLNTVIPYNDDTYYNLRPDIAIAKTTASQLDLNGDLGLHPALSPLESYFGEGAMTVLQNVGYPAPNLSHFRSTDIWLSASDAEVVESTGWLGRYLATAYPNFSEAPPAYPLAVQIGGAVSQMFRGPEANMGMSMISADFFDRLANGSELYNTQDIPQTTYGDEMAYMRSVVNESFQYAEAIQTAAATGVNQVEYAQNNPLARNLETVARLIKGQLGAKIYHVTLSGFDTHSNQPGNHATLLARLGEALDAFMRDIALDESDNEVLAMTFSEFGRRVEQNGSNGTDHGAAAPLFLLGNGLNGGLFGDAPNLLDLQGGNLKHKIDFRSVYGTLLQDWFGLDQSNVEDALLGYQYESLNFIQDPAANVNTESFEHPLAFTLQQNYPNPFNPTTTLTYNINQAGRVRLEVFDIQGRRINMLVDEVRPAGEHRVSFNAGDLPSGTYIYRLITPQGLQSKKMTLLR